jgi:hypothetical protein
MSCSVGIRTRVPIRGRLSTRPSASSRCMASVIGRKLMLSRSASLRRDNTSPIERSPLRISSRICWYALPASDSPEGLERVDTISGFFKPASLFKLSFRNRSSEPLWNQPHRPDVTTAHLPFLPPFASHSLSLCLQSRHDDSRQRPDQSGGDDRS